jgi:hypothetical protein
MEQRLALSAAPLSDYVLTLDGDWSGLKLSGGSVAFEQVFTGIYGSSLGITRSEFFSYVQDNAFKGFVDIRDGEFIFNGPILSAPDVQETLESSEANSPVTPIPQPQIGNGEIAEGIIAVAEIFRPANATVSPAERSVVDEPVVEATVARTVDDSWKSVSLARARDMYFEVAALADDSETGDADLATEIAPLMYQQSVLRREAERASATTSEERVSTPQQLPTVPRQEAQPAETRRSDTPANDAAAEKTQRTAQDGEVPQVDEVSQVADPRDHVFAVWNDGDELSNEGIALRTETQQGHSASWPALAALAVTGWMARTRRAKGVLPSHRQPLRRR